MENLKNIIKEILSYRKELNFNPSDDTILECSTRIFNSMNINKNKIEISDRDNKPTEKQINTLKKLGVKDIDKLTRNECTKIIGDKFKENKKEY